MINHQEIARDLYALGSWVIVAILIAALAFLRNTSLLIEVIIALSIAFVINSIFNPDERIVRLIIVLTTVGLLAGTTRGVVIVAVIALTALVMTSRHLKKSDVWRSAIIGVLVQGLALIAASFI